MLDQQAQMRLVPELLRIAVRAGAAIREVYAHGRFETEQKADDSPLTVADRRAHAIIDAGLTALSAHIPILSEEGTHLPYSERRHWDELWLVDPLDGTKEFIKHTDDFTVNIALVQHQEPVLGVIYAPVTGETWVGLAAPRAYDAAPGDSGRGGPAPPAASSAREGLEPRAGAGGGGSDPAGGRPPAANRAWKLSIQDESDVHQTFELDREAQEIRVRARPADPATADVTIMVSKSHMNEETAAALEQAEAAFGRVRTTNIGSSLKLCKVAEGSVDLYPRNAPTSEWDTAAGHAIVRAAGGEIWQAGPEVEAQTHPLVYNKPDLLNPWFLVRAWQAPDG